jgi:hypothetical protein
VDVCNIGSPTPAYEYSTWIVVTIVVTKYIDQVFTLVAIQMNEQTYKLMQYGFDQR